MQQYIKRSLCLLFILIFTFNFTVIACDDGPEDFEDDNTPTTEIDFSEPSDTTFDDTVWTIELEDGTEELYNPNARWAAIEAVSMALDFKTGGKAAFATTAIAQKTSQTVKIKTQLQSYRGGDWKTLYTKTKTSTYSSTTNSGSYYVTKGYKYRTRNTITVYNSSGKALETDTLNCTRTYK